MRRFFIKDFKKDMPISTTGFANGVRWLAEAFERMTLGFGHVEWREGHIPHLVMDPLLVADQFGTVAPKAFDIKSIDKDTGTLTLTRCKWQIGSKYYSHADVSLTAQTGTLCAVLDTTAGTLTAQMDYEWTDTQPELVPYALYDITVSTVDEKQVVVITCDRRGSSINIYE
jgi:hypothetical protein